MARFMSTRFMVCILLLSIGSAGYAADRVAVMDFENKSQYGGWRLGRGASDMLNTELVKTGKFTMLERDRINAILKEQTLGASGRVDPTTASKIGKLIGAEYIVTGAVTEYGRGELGGSGRGVDFKKQDYQATVDIRMVNVTTGEIVFAESVSGTKSSYNVRVFGIGGGEKFNQKKATEALRIAIQSGAAKITSTPIRLSPAGRSGKPAAPLRDVLVADVDGSLLTLNQGKSAGFRVGQNVGIYRTGKVIKDPVTGKVLKKKYKKVGEIKLTVVEDSYSEGQIINGRGFRVGDNAKP